MSLVEETQPPITDDQAAERWTQDPAGNPVPTGWYPNVPNGLASTVEWQGDPVAELPDDTPRPNTVDASGSQAIDQHPWVDITQTWTPAPNLERPSGTSDPLTMGPPEPTIRQLSAWYNREAGASVSQFRDAPGVQYPTNGSQDGASWTYYQDPARSQIPWTPALLGTDGQMPDSLRALPPSPPRGWAVQPLTVTTEDILATTAALQQQQPGPTNWRSTSTVAGQSWGQGTAQVPQQSGEVQSWRSRV